MYELYSDKCLLKKISLFFFFCNSHIIKSTLLKCTIQWFFFLVYSKSCALPTTIKFQSALNHPYGGLISQRYPGPHLWNLCVLLYIIKGTLHMWLRVLRPEDYPGLSGWPLKCNYKCSYKRKTEGDLTVEGDVTTEADGEKVMWCEEGMMSPKLQDTSRN